MRPTDFPFAAELANTMNWKMAESDFEFSSRLEPYGCFVLFEGEEQIGIATCITYGEMGWFGNLAVKKSHRRSGAGSFLVDHATRYLRNRGVKTIGLYAYQHLIDFYGQAGFVSDVDFAVFSGKVKPYHEEVSISQATKKDLAALVSLDKKCFRWDRARLFKSILDKKASLGFLHVENHKIKTFIGAKVYDEIAEVGPLICFREESETAQMLLKNMLGRLAGLEIFTCVPTEERGLVKALQESCLTESFRLTRMFLGPKHTPNCVYMPESLERG